VYKQILRDTFASVFEHKDSLFKALIIPTVLLVIFQQFTHDVKATMENGVTNYYEVIPATVLIIIFNITIAITAHRVLLLGEDSIPKWGIFKLSKRELGFAWNIVLLVLLCLLATTIFGLFLFLIFYAFELFVDLSFIPEDLLIGAAFMLAFLPSIFIVSSISLIFPSIATNKPITMTEAWRLANNHRMLCFVTVIVFPIIFGAIFGFVYGIVIGFLVNLIAPELDILYPILDVFISVFTISALSHTYKYLVQNNEDSFLENESKDESALLPKNESEELKVEAVLQVQPTEENNK